MTNAPAPRLSVSLPVYNFGKFLGETLASILPQATPEVEVVVVDGASTDDTQAVVERLLPSWPNLRYIRLERKGGIDADMARTVEVSRGEYVWLFSGDDVMRPGAIARLLGLLDERHDVYVCRHTLCDKEMRFLQRYPIFATPGTRRLDLHDPARLGELLAEAMNTEALFSFMSGLTVRRETWCAIQPGERFVGSCWAHSARLFALAGRGRLSVCYVDEEWLDKRGENDSFTDRGMVHRLRIAVDGFLGIVDELLATVPGARGEVRRLLRNELPVDVFAAVYELTLRHPEREDRAELRRLYHLCHGRALPLPLALVLRKAKRGALRLVRPLLSAQRA